MPKDYIAILSYSLSYSTHFMFAGVYAYFIGSAINEDDL